MHALKNTSPAKTKFYAISAGDTKKKIKKFIKKNPFHYEILMDADKAYSKSIGVESLPVTLIIRQGKIIYSGHRPPKSIN